MLPSALPELAAGDRAVVLGGGGLVGVAWGCGYLTGLAEAGVDLGDADRVVGTSAGSTVGAWLTSGRPMAERYRRLERSNRPVERALAGVFGHLATRPSHEREQALELLFSGSACTDDELRELGRLAIAAKAMPEPLFVAFLTTLVGRRSWQGGALAVTAHDTASGERVVIAPAARVSLAKACAASSAVPGVLPPVTVRGQRLMDGGCRSGTSCDLAAGAGRVVVLSLLAHRFDGTPPYQVEADLLVAQGARVHVSAPADDVVDLVGTDLMSAAPAADVLRLARAQAAREADTVAAIWR